MTQQLTSHLTDHKARSLTPTLLRRLPRAGNANRTANPTTAKHAAQRPSAWPTAKGDS